MTTTQVGRMLDEEHRANLDLLSRIEQAIGRAPGLTPQLTSLLVEFAHAMEHDIGRHFRFEEEHLFPRMADAGDGSIAALMREEHEAIREAASELIPLAREAAAGTIDEEGWDRLRLVALELVERQVSHIQKETMAVLPMLEDLLDPDTDGELALEYAATA
ncbi:MAG TPA: hemerythrin domain-containing protein [Ramlibacter sp.]